MILARGWPLACGLWLAGCGSALAQVDQQAAYDLCVAQPGLQSEAIRPFIHETLAKPHNPKLNQFTEEQLISQVQSKKGQECAATLLTRPEVMKVIADQQIASKDALEYMWIAFNTYCRKAMTPRCLTDQTNAMLALSGNQTPAAVAQNNACSWLLRDEVDPVQRQRCAAQAPSRAVADTPFMGCFKPEEQRSMKDGTLAGRRVAACLSANSP